MSVQPHQRVIDAALREGPVKFPVGGFLYFPHRGKLSKIKSVTLVYAAPGRPEVTAKLR